MLISRTPYRVSFLGGGSDVKEWYSQHNGRIISAAINRYIYIALNQPFNDNLNENKFRVIWRKIDSVSHPKEISHPVVRETLKYFDIKKPIELFYSGDLPSRSGIGSSSAFTVGLISLLSKHYKFNLSKKKIINIAIDIERNRLKEFGGIQDQIRCANGGIGYIKINKKSNFLDIPINLSKKNLNNLENSIKLIYVGGSRSSSNLMKKQISSIPTQQKNLERMCELTEKCFLELHTNNKLNCVNVLSKYIREGWSLKKSFNHSITNKHINSIYEHFMNKGAYCGKIMGAGQSGFMFFLSNKNFAINRNTSIVSAGNIKIDNEGVKVYSF
jgi:D-glycero-alpha-D-manno-heptose-7-phosphate kinase